MASTMTLKAYVPVYGEESANGMASASNLYYPIAIQVPCEARSSDLLFLVSTDIIMSLFSAISVAVATILSMIALRMVWRAKTVRDTSPPQAAGKGASQSLGGRPPECDGTISSREIQLARQLDQGEGDGEATDGSGNTESSLSDSEGWAGMRSQESADTDEDTYEEEASRGSSVEDEDEDSYNGGIDHDDGFESSGSSSSH